MGTAAKSTRENRTITVDFQNETASFQLLGDGKAFVECVFAFLLSLGFHLKHKATCRGGGCLTRHSHYVRVRLGGVTIWRLQCTTSGMPSRSGNSGIVPLPSSRASTTHRMRNFTAATFRLRF
jgi:hypothetical protein